MKKETITLIPEESMRGLQWAPVQDGTETSKLLRSLDWPLDAKTTLIEETAEILSMCGNPKRPTNNDTGLVFGYVQSGKTLSFTALAAMARDNDYQMIIVIAGSSKHLVKQSTERLKKDLKIKDRKWRVFSNPRDQDTTSIASSLEAWRLPSTPTDARRSVLITVMKNKTHLEKLVEILRSLEDIIMCVPTLIIDDESDQASLNTKAGENARKILAGKSGKEESTIYRKIGELKAALPHHTFLQYTATPQANLFINIMDRLSPSFIQLLTPGKNYTGGQAFFLERPDLIRRIPPAEIYSDNHQFNEPPSTLLEAMRIFYLGAAIGEIRRVNGVEEEQENRSMMIHPSQKTDKHDRYATWAILIRDRWKKVLAESPSSSDRKQELKRFQTAYNDLRSSITDSIPEFDEIANNRLAHIIQSTPIIRLNSKSSQNINWEDEYSNILVGGQAMDRGFTVEGLTVTYMPRGLGVANADTIQQRARFYGYKKKYIGFCRIYLADDGKAAYSKYPEHEENVRARLLAHKLTGKHLNQLERAFVLDEMFNLTRSNVLSGDIERNRIGLEWFRIDAPHDSIDSFKENQKTYNLFMRSTPGEWFIDKGHSSRTEEQKHLYMDFPLQEVLDNFLMKLKYMRLKDSTRFTDLKSVLKNFLEKSTDAKCRVYLMTKGKPRHRSLDERNDEVEQLFQGRNPKKSQGDPIYPGDSEIRDNSKVTIQIHMLNLKEPKTGRILHENVVTIAAWIPKEVGVKAIVRLIPKRKRNT